MQTTLAKPAKSQPSTGRSIYYYWQNSKKLNFERYLGQYVLKYCDRRYLQLINIYFGTVYNLYRCSVYLSYDYWFLNLYFVDKEVVFSGKSTRVRRLFLPGTFDRDSFRKVAFSRIQACLMRNKPAGMGYYFITLPRDVNVKGFLSRYFYKSSSYRYIEFKEHGSCKGGLYSHKHYIAILPEGLKAKIPGDDRRLIYVDCKDLPRTINYCLKVIKPKSVNASRTMCLPKLSRLNKSKLQTMLSFVFADSQLNYFFKTYKNRDGDDCVRVGLKFAGGIDAKGYSLKMKKRIK